MSLLVRRCVSLTPSGLPLAELWRCRGAAPADASAASPALGWRRRRLACQLRGSPAGGVHRGPLLVDRPAALRRQGFHRCSHTRRHLHAGRAVCRRRRRPFLAGARVGCADQEGDLARAERRSSSECQSTINWLERRDTDRRYEPRVSNTGHGTHTHTHSYTQGTEAQHRGKPRPTPNWRGAAPRENAAVPHGKSCSAHAPCRQLRYGALSFVPSGSLAPIWHYIVLSRALVSVVILFALI